jgi:predicted ATPase with chaperone activity
MSTQSKQAGSETESMRRLEDLCGQILDRLDRMERNQEMAVVKNAYTTEAAAKRLGRSVWTVRQWCNKAQVRGAYKVRGKGRTGEWRLTHDAVVELQSRGPAAEGSFPQP